MKRAVIIAAFLAAALSACQKYDFSEEAELSPDEEWRMPVGTGEGTVLRPYTAEDIRSGNFSSGEECWVIGYVVGAAYQSIANSEFSPSTTFTRNILLSSDSICTSYMSCLPVELSSTSLQKRFALPHNPQGFRQCLMLRGTPRTYYNKNGLRDIRTGHWMYHFDISSIHPRPQEWKRDTIW